jgi:cob(I)alamin adenosyltransferase
MNIYTRTGDAGETGIIGGKRVPKDSPVVEALGDVDELNTLIGIIVTKMREGDIGDISTLKKIQNRLFNIGSIIADVEARLGQIESVRSDDVVYLESVIDTMEVELSPLRQFILPGGSELAGLCFHARAVCRRAERRISVLVRVYDGFDSEVFRYMNRLSDLLFVYARTMNARVDVADEIWER